MKSEALKSNHSPFNSQQVSAVLDASYNSVELTGPERGAFCGGSERCREAALCTDPEPEVMEELMRQAQELKMGYEEVSSLLTLWSVGAVAANRIAVAKDYLN